jgi:hypothetical protein
MPLSETESNTGAALLFCGDSAEIIGRGCAGYKWIADNWY